MRVYIVQEPAEQGGNEIRVYSRSGAIKEARAAYDQPKYALPDTRTDDEALDEFVAVHWAWAVEVIE